jgi:hypothetical protein
MNRWPSDDTRPVRVEDLRRRLDDGSAWDSAISRCSGRALRSGTREHRHGRRGRAAGTTAARIQAFQIQEITPEVVTRRVADLNRRKRAPSSIRFVRGKRRRQGTRRKGRVESVSTNAPASTTSSQPYLAPCPHCWSGRTSTVACTGERSPTCASATSPPRGSTGTATSGPSSRRLTDGRVPRRRRGGVRTTSSGDGVAAGGDLPRDLTDRYPTPRDTTRRQPPNGIFVVNPTHRPARCSRCAV